LGFENIGGNMKMTQAVFIVNFIHFTLAFVIFIFPGMELIPDTGAHK